MPPTFALATDVKIAADSSDEPVWVVDVIVVNYFCSWTNNELQGNNASPFCSSCVGCWMFHMAVLLSCRIAAATRQDASSHLFGCSGLTGSIAPTDRQKSTIHPSATSAILSSTTRFRTGTVTHQTQFRCLLTCMRALPRRTSTRCARRYHESKQHEKKISMTRGRRGCCFCILYG